MNGSGIFLLDCPIQNYPWGSHTALARLQGRAFPTNDPEAELWMGAHPAAPSSVRLGGSDVALSQLIAQSPGEFLGDQLSAKFGGSLPFLLKVLGVARPLSIQVHPSKAQAERGCAREDQTSLSRQDPKRNYKDSNHKPELVCALSEFHALCGFRPTRELRRFLSALKVSEFDPVIAELGAARGRNVQQELLGHWLRLERADSERLIGALRVSLNQHAERGGEFGADAEWIRRIMACYPNDPGILAALLLRHIVLQPGEAMFVGAGILHAYLEGTAVELMANSDNVLRGGLTNKHIDVDELMRVLGGADEQGKRIAPVRHGVEVRYESPASEFELVRLDVGEAPAPRRRESPEIILCVEGPLQICDSAGEMIELLPGNAAFLTPRQENYSLLGPGCAYRASVPKTETTAT